MMNWIDKCWINFERHVRDNNIAMSHDDMSWFNEVSRAIGTQVQKKCEVAGIEVGAVSQPLFLYESENSDCAVAMIENTWFKVNPTCSFESAIPMFVDKIMNKITSTTGKTCYFYYILYTNEPKIKREEFLSSRFVVVNERERNVSCVEITV